MPRAEWGSKEEGLTVCLSLWRESNLGEEGVWLLCWGRGGNGDRHVCAGNEHGSMVRRGKGVPPATHHPPPRLHQQQHGVQHRTGMQLLFWPVWSASVSVSCFRQRVRLPSPHARARREQLRLPVTATDDECVAAEAAEVGLPPDHLRLFSSPCVSLSSDSLHVSFLLALSGPVSSSPPNPSKLQQHERRNNRNHNANSTTVRSTGLTRTCLLPWQAEREWGSRQPEDALRKAAKAGDAELVRRLTAARPDLRDKKGEYGETPLIWAARYGEAAMKGHTEVVEVLVDGGAQLYLQDSNGNTDEWKRCVVIR